ncbi:MAG: hypothetical protein LUI87_14735, partial [Lachnospiraceae bacterium]|nr:hypothetical protein [Lachnospiraceae bacterium]
METEKDFTIPKLFESGCVLQRGEKTRVWGWAPPGASVEVILLEQKTDNETDRLSRAKSRPQGSVPIETRSGQVQAPDASIENYEETVVARCAAKADADGRFTSYFENLKAGGPYTLVFLCREVPAEIQETSSADCGQASRPQDEDMRNPQSEARGAAWQKICCLEGGDSSTFQAERGLSFEKIEAPDVWVGDVFVCAGQSNMELPMRRVREKYPEEFLNGGRDRVHVYKVQEAYNFKREASEHADASWNPPFAETSAFSWFLGKELSQKEEVPIGILNLSLGGTPIQAWMSEDALEDWPEYQKEKAVLSDDEYCRTLTAQKAAEEAAWQKVLCEKEREVWPPQEIK